MPTKTECPRQPFLPPCLLCTHLSLLATTPYYLSPRVRPRVVLHLPSLPPRSDAKAPIILQVSQGGAAFFGGKGLKNDQQQASIAGAVAAAHYVRAIAPAYGVPVIMHSDHCAKKLLPWFDGMLEADEAYYKEHGEPLFS